MKVGQWYKNGDTYECVFITPSGNIVLRNTRVGTEFVESKDNAIFYKLIPPPPKVFTGYALVYPFGWNSAKFAVGNLYGSLEEMDSHHKENDINLGKALAKIKITFTEGEGLVNKEDHEYKNDCTCGKCNGDRYR